MIKHGRQRVPVNEICLHTSATPGDWYVGKSVEGMTDEIRRWHMKQRRWQDIGYHRVISPDGNLGIGRSIYKPGAGVKGHNQGVIHICLIPHVTHDGIKQFSDYFTREQRIALIRYFYELDKITPIERITGHNEFANKECPGFRVNDTWWLQALVK